MVGVWRGVVIEITELLAVAREATARREWIAARDAFAAARARGPLGGDDLYALGNCHWWLGALDEALPALQVSSLVRQPRGLAVQRPGQGECAPDRVGRSMGHTCSDSGY
jgi:hypothetical protein